MCFETACNGLQANNLPCDFWSSLKIVQFQFLELKNITNELASRFGDENRIGSRHTLQVSRQIGCFTNDHKTACDSNSDPDWRMAFWTNRFGDFDDLQGGMNTAFSVIFMSARVT